MNTSKFVTITTATKISGLSPTTLRRLGDEGKIKQYRDPLSKNHRRAFSRAELENLATRRPQ